MKLIGLSGKIGTGKSATAKYIVALAPWKRMGFADPLKREVSEALGIPMWMCYTERGKDSSLLIPFDVQLLGFQKKRAKLREVLQWWGTEFRREQDPDYWLKRMDEVIERDISERGITKFVIEDVRFKNEAQWILERGGFLARLEPHEKWTPGPNAHHKSEVDLDDFDGFSAVYRPKYGDLIHVARDILSRVG